MGITEFLEARIAEDERQYEVCRELGWYPAKKYGVPALSHSRFLAECAAKRAIVEQHEAYIRNMPGKVGIAWVGARCGQEATAGAVKALAIVYKDHPDFQEEWSEL